MTHDRNSGRGYVASLLAFDVTVISLIGAPENSRQKANPTNEECNANDAQEPEFWVSETNGCE